MENKFILRREILNIISEEERKRIFELICIRRSIEDEVSKRFDLYGYKVIKENWVYVSQEIKQCMDDAYIMSL